MSLILSIVFALGPAYAAAQEPGTFALPDARAGELYQANIESVLRDAYRLKLDTATNVPIIQWYLAQGDMTPGLALRTDGLISGTPGAASVGTYWFKIKVVDRSAKDSDLVLNFTLNVNPGKLRLSRIEGPRLVPLESQRSLAAYQSLPAALSVDPKVEPERPILQATVEPGRVLGGTPPQGRGPSIIWATPGVANGESIDHFTEAQKSLLVKVADQSQMICLLDTLVLDDHSRVISNQKSAVDYNNDAKQKIEVGLAKGDNIIKVTAYAKKTEKQKCGSDTDLTSLMPLENPLTYTVHCDSGACGTAEAKADKKEQNTNPFSNKYTRAIFGIEQSGASSAASEAHPFLDFFFNAPLTGRRLLAWGDIRLTTTPQQVTAFISSTANVGTAITGNKVNDIATSFDFRFGPELQLNPGNQDHRVSLIVGFGATSPLTAPEQTAQIFKVPTEKTNSQFANFFVDYPEAVGKTYIAFVRPERDRFLRQYYAGLRLKSYPRGDKFPSMLDVTFGQNSAVTGGKLRHFVLGIDGSYHLTFFDKSMYIFGSTNLKFGGDKMVRTPYVLEPADTSVKLTSPDLTITARQMNRDVFRIGFGIDLVELFKPKDKKAEEK
jgi:hypothetical protein